MYAVKTHVYCVMPAEVGDDPRQRGRDDRLVERREQQRHHQPGVDREDPPDRELVAGWLAASRSRRSSRSPGHEPPAGSRRESTMPAAISDAAADLQRRDRLGEDQQGEDRAEERLQVRVSEARDGPTRSIELNQSRLVKPSGPSTAKTKATQTRRAGAEVLRGELRRRRRSRAGPHRHREYERADPRGRVPGHQRRDRDRVRRPGRRREERRAHSPKDVHRSRPWRRPRRGHAAERDSGARPRSGHAGARSRRAPRTAPS